MADRMRTDAKALVTPGDPDAPYSDPVTAAPAAAPTDTERFDWIEARVSEPWSSLHDLLGMPITYWPKQVNRLTLRKAIDAVMTAAVRPPIADEER